MHNYFSNSRFWFIFLIFLALLFSFQFSFKANNDAEAFFSDVSEDHPQYEAIQYLQEKGILAGYPDGTFKPDQPINRAEILKILIFGIQIDPEQENYVPSCFPDVEEGFWFEPYVCIAKENGWVEGYEDGFFRPEQTLNKAEAIKLLVISQNYPFHTVSEGEVWYNPYLESAQNQDILEMDEVFSAGAPLTRSGFSEWFYLAHLKIGAPQDEAVRYELGDLVITTYNPVTFSSLENSTNLSFIVKNEGNEAQTVQRREAQQEAIPWIKHLFWVQDGKYILEPGEEAVWELMIAPEIEEGGLFEGEQIVQFEVTESGKSIEIPILFRMDTNNTDVIQDATVGGHVRDSEGQGLEGAKVSIYLFNGTQFWNTETDENGDYRLSFPSQKVLAPLLGERPLPYNSLDPFLTVEKEGYETIFMESLLSEEGENLTKDFELEPLEGSVSYELNKELRTEGVYGFWWIFAHQSFDFLAAVQARHPPELDAPGFFLMLNQEGEELWRYETNNECWGFDVSVDGKVGAGCHDGQIYVTNFEGELLWELYSGGQNREMEFSPDGQYLFTGPYPDNEAALLNAETGEAIWTYNSGDEWLRSSRFNPDGQRILASFSGGKTLLFDIEDGNMLWEQGLGEFSFLMEFDQEGNVYTGGKNRTIKSFDEKGELRWTYRVPDHVVGAGSDQISEEGGILAFGTVGGWLYAFEFDGTLLWRTRISGIFQGHNALDMTPDGEWILIGSNAEKGAYLSLYNKNGTLVWSDYREDYRDESFSYDYDHNHIGAITVAIADDASKIVAAYGDSTIRIFTVLPSSN